MRRATTTIKGMHYEALESRAEALRGEGAEIIEMQLDSPGSTTKVRRGSVIYLFGQAVYEETLRTSRDGQRWNTMRWEPPKARVRRLRGAYGGMSSQGSGTFALNELRGAVKAACWTLTVQDLLSFVTERGALPDELEWALDTPSGAGLPALLTDAHWLALLQGPSEHARVTAMRLFARFRGPSATV